MLWIWLNSEMSSLNLGDTYAFPVSVLHPCKSWVGAVTGLAKTVFIRLDKWVMSFWAIQCVPKESKKKGDMYMCVTFDILISSLCP